MNIGKPCIKSVNAKPFHTCRFRTTGLTDNEVREQVHLTLAARFSTWSVLNVFKRILREA